MLKKLLAEFLREKHPEKMDTIMNSYEAMTKDMKEEFWRWVETYNGCLGKEREGMEIKKFDELMEKVKTAVTKCGRCDECPYGGENNECPKKLHKDIGVLLDAFKEQMSAVIAEKSDICRKVVAIEDERMYLEKRLKHLLQSETIRQFDEISPRNGDYARDISDLDEMMKSSVQKEAAEAIFAKIAKNCENHNMSADELKKHVEVFDHMRQACKGGFTRIYG